METALRAILLASSGVTALAPAARINWGAHPQGAGYPALVLNVISDAEGLVMNGPNGLFEGRVQIDAYADSYPEAKDLSRAVIAVLHGLRNTNFRLVTHVASRDSRETGTNEAGRPFRVSMDFTTAWRA